MSSKQLKSILSTMPSATIKGEIKSNSDVGQNDPNMNLIQKAESNERIVARIPKSLKEEIKNYIREHKGETETTVLMKALKLMGFNVPQNLLVDKRSLR